MLSCGLGRGVRVRITSSDIVVVSAKWLALELPSTSGYLDVLRCSYDKIDMTWIVKCVPSMPLKVAISLSFSNERAKRNAAAGWCGLSRWGTCAYAPPARHDDHQPSSLYPPSNVQESTDVNWIGWLSPMPLREGISLAFNGQERMDVDGTTTRPAHSNIEAALTCAAAQI